MSLSSPLGDKKLHSSAQTSPCNRSQQEEHHICALLLVYFSEACSFEGKLILLQFRMAVEEILKGSACLKGCACLHLHLSGVLLIYCNLVLSDAKTEFHLFLCLPAPHQVPAAIKIITATCTREQKLSFAFPLQWV